MRQKQSKPSWESVHSSRRWSVAEGSWVIAKLERSGLRAVEFARRHQLPVIRVYQWRHRLRGEQRQRDARAVATPRLLEVKLPTERGRAQSTDRIEIELHNGRRLSAPAGIDLERLAALVALLERS